MNTQQHIERFNFVNDARNSDAAEKPVLYLEDQEIELPTTWGVCPVCDGEGSHVNPSIDAGGLSHTQQSDPDFMRDYMGGVYDVPCNCCGGRTTVQVVDWDMMPEEHVKAYEEQLEQESADAAMHRAELACGA